MLAGSFVIKTELIFMTLKFKYKIYILDCIFTNVKNENLPGHLRFFKTRTAYFKFISLNRKTSQQRKKKQINLIFTV